MLNTVANNDLGAARTAAKAFIDFNATWCGPCRMLAPIVDELADEYDGQVEFYSVDVDENPDLAAEFGVMSIPTLVVLKGGQEAAKQVGFIPKDALKALIDRA
ncbi:MAG: thioredoxin [Oscillospiraceae bacterium]|nr:thioredoxin [Oscillospiraceae bacterium]